MTTPAITPEITRADAADYLDRSNWNPDQARALAAKETLTNLGAHPAVVDKAATPDSFSIPSPGLGKPQTVAPIATPLAPKPAPSTELTPDSFMAQQKPAELTPDSFMAKQAQAAAVPSIPSPIPPRGQLPNGGDTGEGPIAQGLTTMETKLANMGTSALQGSTPQERIDNLRAQTVAGNVKNANPIATQEGSLPMNIGATAANLLPLLLRGGKEAPKPTIEPIPDAPLTPGETSGPGMLANTEQLFSKTPGAAKTVGEFMGERTAAIKNAADKVAPDKTGAEEVGANIQNAGRDVLAKKEQAQGLTEQFADRANQELEEKQNAATADKGRAMQETAAGELEKRRTAGVQGGKDIAKDISGHDELPVAEADRKIIDSLRNANQSAHAEEGSAHEALTKEAKARGVTVDPSPMQDVAKGIVQLEGPAKDLVMSSLPASTYRMLEKVAKGSPEEGDILAQRAKDFGWNPADLSDNQKAAIQKDMQNNPTVPGQQEATSAVPYDVMKTARTAVGEALQASRKHFQSTGMGSNAGRALTNLYGSMTDALKTSLEPHKDLTAQFEKANALTKDRNSRFVDPKFVRSLVYKGDSQKVVGAVMRSGGQVEAQALVNAIGKDPLAMGPLKRAAMDHILKRSTKDATGELPGTIRPDKLDYDLAVRNAENSPALKTLLGDEGYNKFHSELEQKRLAARDPEEVRFEDYLQKVIKADTPEKAAKHAGDDANFNKLSKTNPDLAKEDSSVQAASQRVSAAKGAVEKLKPTVDTKGVDTVTKGIANELEPSSIIERAAKSPEYTQKLLEVIDRAPNKDELRNQLGQRIYHNALDKSMVNGAFGSTEGIMDTGKAHSEYAAIRPSLQQVLPEENVKAMDELDQSIRKYTLSQGIGGAGGTGGRFMQMRQLFAWPMMIHGVLTANPATAGMGAAVLAGPKLWMQFATHPEFTRAVAASMRAAIPSGAKLAGVAGMAKAINDSQDLSRRDLGQTSDTNAQNTTKQTNSGQPIQSPPTHSFEHPKADAVKRKGWAAALRSKNTPDHLRPHLEKNLAQ